MLKLKPLAGLENKFISALKRISAQTEGAPGCLESSLLQPPGQSDCLCYFERWASDADLKRHLKTENYRKLLCLIEASADVPALDFYHVVDHEGTESVQ